MAQRINPDANNKNALKMFNDVIKCQCDSISPACDYLFIWAFVSGSVNEGYADPSQQITIDITSPVEAGSELTVGFALLSGTMNILSATPSGDFAADWTVEQSLPFAMTPIEPPTPTAFLKLQIDPNEPSGSFTSIVTFETEDCGTIEVTFNYDVVAIELGYQALMYIAEVVEVTPGVYDIVGTPSMILNSFQNGVGPTTYPLSSPVPVSTTGLFAFLAYAISVNALPVDILQPDASAATDLLQIALNTIPDPTFPVTIDNINEQFLGAFLLNNGDPGSYTDSSVMFDISPSNPLYQLTLVLPYDAAP